jgi:hypothetical protein
MDDRGDERGEDGRAPSGVSLEGSLMMLPVETGSPESLISSMGRRE